MALPVAPVRRPSVLNGTQNGRLPAAILVSTPGLAGGPTVRLVAPAARAWRALTAAAQKAGYTLKATSAVDSYRPYDVQERIFRQRFTTTPTGRTSRYWQGRTWYLKPGYALAAVPGTSNHGWGLAVDTGEELDGDPGTESLSRRTLNWLIANAGAYGWSWEVQSEPWHIRYVAGDNIPAAVLAYERGAPAPAPSPNQGVCDVKVRILKRGDKGGTVKSLQALLNAKSGSNLRIDGDFGPATDRQVRAVQRFFGVSVDGVVGSVTWGLLFL